MRGVVENSDETSPHVFEATIWMAGDAGEEFHVTIVSCSAVDRADAEDQFAAMLIGAPPEYGFTIERDPVAQRRQGGRHA